MHLPFEIDVLEVGDEFVIVDMSTIAIKDHGCPTCGVRYKIISFGGYVEHNRNERESPEYESFGAEDGMLTAKDYYCTCNDPPERRVLCEVKSFDDYNRKDTFSEFYVKDELAEQIIRSNVLAPPELNRNNTTQNT